MVLLYVCFGDAVCPRIRNGGGTGSGVFLLYIFQDKGCGRKKASGFSGISKDKGSGCSWYSGNVYEYESVSMGCDK